jgi:hypothetical protein
MQHSALSETKIQALSSASNRHVHQPAFFLEARQLKHAILMRKQSFFHPRDKYSIELEAFSRVDSHQLNCLLASLRLIVACL